MPCAEYYQFVRELIRRHVNVSVIRSYLVMMLAPWEQIVMLAMDEAVIGKSLIENNQSEGIREEK
jgi:hypothetical protein